MRILLAAGLYPPDIGGPATYASMLSRELPDHGITLTVVPYGSVRHLPKVCRHAAYTWKLWQAACATDGIYALDPMSVGVPARVVAGLRRQPLVVRLGGDYVWEQSVQRFGITSTLDEYTNTTKGRPLVVRILAAVQTWVVQGAKQVIVPSAYLKRIVACWGIAETKIAVVYSAHTPLTTTFNREALREDFNFTGLVLVSAARLTPWKGMGALITLVAERVKRGDKTTLVIAGDGPQRGVLEAKALAAGIQSHVRFVGPLSQDALFAVVAAADIFVLNTAYEGLSHQLIEVMDIGTPIITTPVGGNPELLTNGVEGLMVPFNDVAGYDEAVTLLVSNTARRQQLVTAAKERCLTFASTDAVRAIATVLKNTYIKE